METGHAMTAVVPAVMRTHRKNKWAEENAGEEDDLLNHDNGAPPFLSAHLRLLPTPFSPVTAARH